MDFLFQCILLIINFDNVLLLVALSSEKAAERGLLSKTSRNKFIQSIKSRLAVAQVVEGMHRFIYFHRIHWL